MADESFMKELATSKLTDLYLSLCLEAAKDGFVYAK